MMRCDERVNIVTKISVFYIPGWKYEYLQTRFIENASCGMEIGAIQNRSLTMCINIFYLCV